MPPSATLDYEDRPVKLRSCDCPGCAEAADYRAPKSRDHLNDYYWFCLEHVREYNRNWDYFAGLSIDAIEAYNRNANVWERPSWPMGEWFVREQRLREQVMNDFFADAAVDAPTPPLPKAERDALEMLELKPPVTFAMVKAQYRLLVKRHHPDANSGSAESGEKFKCINQAFTVLKRMYAVDDAS